MSDTMPGYTIVSRDLMALRFTMFAVFLPILIAGLVVVLVLTGASINDVILPVALGVVMLISAPCLLGYLAKQRIGKIRRVLSEGEHVSGIVSDAWYSLPWPLSKTPKANIEYVYLVNGESYVGSAEVVRCEATLGFKRDDKVTVAVIADRPKEAFMVELYQL